MTSFDSSTRITLPREALLQFFGKMALPPWTHADGQMCGGDVDCAPIATEITDWIDANEIHAVPTANDAMPAVDAYPVCDEAECNTPYVLRLCYVFTSGSEGETWLWQRDCKHKKAGNRVERMTKVGA